MTSQERALIDAAKAWARIDTAIHRRGGRNTAGVKKLRAQWWEMAIRVLALAAALDATPTPPEEPHDDARAGREGE